MFAPSRRSVLELVGGVALGVGAAAQRPNWPGLYGGELQAWVLEEVVDEREVDEYWPPDDVLVSREDDRIADVDPIQEVLADDVTATVSVSRREYRRVDSVLDDLPYYDAPPDAPVLIQPGVYVHDGEYTRWLTLYPYCSESVFFEARNGDHAGRGGRFCQERG